MRGQDVLPPCVTTRTLNLSSLMYLLTDKWLRVIADELNIEKSFVHTILIQESQLRKSKTKKFIKRRKDIMQMFLLVCVCKSVSLWSEISLLRFSLCHYSPDLVPCKFFYFRNANWSCEDSTGMTWKTWNAK